MDNSEIFGYPLPNEVIEEVFSYLDCIHILDSSLVNWSWFNFIANSNMCMKKIKIKVSAFDLQEEVKKIQRNYVHLYCIGSIWQIEKIFGARQWKSIELFRVNFSTADKALKFFHVINDCVEEIKLNKIYIDSGYWPSHKYEFTFPKLKSLELMNIQNLLYYEIFAYCKNLIELNIVSEKLTVRSLSAIKKMLYENHKLQRLALVTQHIDEYFQEDITEKINFRLKYFELRDVYNLSEECSENVKIFLRFHMNTLESLDIGDWFGIEYAKIAFDMPILKSLTFRKFYRLEDNLPNIRFKKNPSITFLHLNEPMPEIEFMKCCVPAVPNLNHLKLFSLKQDALEYLKNAVPNIEILSVQFLEALDVSRVDFFPKLKEFSMLMFMEEITASPYSEKKLERLIALIQGERKEKSLRFEF
jgi:F-box domain